MGVLNEKGLLKWQVCGRNLGRVLGLDVLLESWGLSGLGMKYRLLCVFLTNDCLGCRDSGLVLERGLSFQNPNYRRHLVLLTGL
jgi:hypothetical protein